MEDTNSTSMPLQAGQLWRELSQEIRKPFDMQAKLLKADYAAPSASLSGVEINRIIGDQ